MLAQKRTLWNSAAASRDQFCLRPLGAPLCLRSHRPSAQSWQQKRNTCPPGQRAASLRAVCLRQPASPELELVAASFLRKPIELRRWPIRGQFNKLAKGALSLVGPRGRGGGRAQTMGGSFALRQDCSLEPSYLTSIKLLTPLFGGQLDGGLVLRPTSSGFNSLRGANFNSKAGARGLQDKQGRSLIWTPQLHLSQTRRRPQNCRPPSPALPAAHLAARLAGANLIASQTN